MSSKIFKMTIAGFAVAILAVTIMFASGSTHAQADTQDQVSTEMASEMATTDKAECQSTCTEMKSCGDMTKEECVKVCEMKCDKKK